MPSPLPVTIVIVDDEPGHARLIERGLRRAHMTKDVVILRDGHEALAQAATAEKGYPSD
jgi:CheY-like chemotaxis protein